MTEGETALSRAQHHLAELEQRLERQVMILEELQQDSNPCEAAWARVVSRTRQAIVASRRSLQALEQQNRSGRDRTGPDDDAAAPRPAGANAPG